MCVGKSDPALVAATADMDNVLHADAPGCGGRILQAMAHFDLIEADAYAPPICSSPGKAELVMVYHRLPVRRAHRQRPARAPAAQFVPTASCPAC